MNFIRPGASGRFCFWAEAEAEVGAGLLCRGLSPERKLALLLIRPLNTDLLSHPFRDETSEMDGVRCTRLTVGSQEAAVPGQIHPQRFVGELSGFA